MKNIHLIPTDKPSSYVTNYMEKEMQWYNIYITSDEEIKEGDWFHLDMSDNDRPDEIHQMGTNKWSKTGGINFSEPNSWTRSCKKIILTTDQNLIKDGVQAIDDEFLEWFVKNPTCEFVKIEPDYDEIRGDYYRIILKEEQPKEIIYYCKQETLEEAAIRLFNDFQKNNPIVPKNNINPYKLGFIDGIKWQQERMYSEEDMIEFAEFVATYSDKNKNVHGQMLHAKSKYDGAERTIDLFKIWYKQHKKK